MTRFAIKTGRKYSKMFESNNYYYKDWVEPGATLIGCQNYSSFTLGGDDYLHFAGLELFDRHEDSKTGQHVSIFGDEIIIDEDLTGNPSDRRDGVCLYFYSELGPNIKMTLSQHKGETLVDFYIWDGKKPAV